MTTAFVAGATGFTGREVVRVLRERKADTVAHVRPDSSKLEVWRERFEAQGARVDTTAWKTEALGDAFQRLAPEVVFCLVGTTGRRAKAARRSGGPPSDFETVDFGLTAMLVDAMKRARPSARFVLLSTVGVSPRSPSSYLRLRWRSEEYVKNSGLPYLIVRPGFIVGPGRDDPRRLEYATGAVLNAVAKVAGGLGLKRWGARYRSITNVDLAEALVRHALDAAGGDRVIEGRALRRAAAPSAVEPPP